jgi:hypothetical protein
VTFTAFLVVAENNHQPILSGYLQCLCPRKDTEGESGSLGTLFRAHSSAWLERFPDKEEVDGSSPSGPTQSLMAAYPILGLLHQNPPVFCEWSHMWRTYEMYGFWGRETRVFVSAGKRVSLRHEKVAVTHPASRCRVPCVPQGHRRSI